MNALAPYVRIVGRGPGRGRPMTQAEASAAMTLILSRQAAPEAIGALLMVMRYRGETDAEIAGFTQALRDVSAGWNTGTDLDWPCYAAGKSRGAPLFLLSAKLVAQAGYRVALHGWNSHQNPVASVRGALDLLQIPMAKTKTDTTGDITYLPLETLCPEALEVLKLRDVLGLRSCMNTVLRMWNPTGATTSVQGVFHPSYRGLQARAGHILGDHNLTVIKGGGGEFERHPSKDLQVFGLRAGAHHETSAPSLSTVTRRLHETEIPVDAVALWAGNTHDEFAIATVIGTAGLALWSLGAASTIENADEIAADLWATRSI